MKLPRFRWRLRQPAVPDTADGPDLQTQLESMLDCVWRAEAIWRLEDRISLVLRFERPTLRNRAPGSKDRIV
jgi:hypothetical protein